METKRICIYAKDVMLITGKSERFGRLLLRRIKTHLSKTEHQVITIKEFSHYMGISDQEMEKYITE